MAFYSASNRNRQIAKLVDVVRRATQEILVINWPASEPPQQGSLDTARLNYFEQLLRRAEDGVMYRRILQLPSLERISSTVAAPLHYHRWVGCSSSLPAMR